MNLSIFRLLAYHKICNDHYTYRQWQPYDASLCNIDYLVPSRLGSLNLGPSLTGLTSNPSKLKKLNLLDLRFSNLPLDYFNGVLPTAQFGKESVVNLNLGSASGTATLSGSTGDPTYSNKYASQLVWDKTEPVSQGTIVSQTDLGGNTFPFVDGQNTGLQFRTFHQHPLSGSASIDTQLSGNLTILALRIS